jgi:hypothetical protein
MGEKERQLSLKSLMDALGSAHPGSAARPPLEAFWQRIAVVIAAIGLVIATVGVIVAAIHVF